MKQAKLLSATIISTLILSGLTACRPADQPLDCSAQARNSSSPATVEIAVVAAPSKNFVDFDKVLSEAKPDILDFVTVDGARFATVLADGQPTQRSETRTDYSKALTDSDRDEEVDRAMFALRKLYSCVVTEQKTEGRVTPGVDLLDGLRVAAESFTEESTERHLLVLSNGISTEGQLKLQSGLPADSAATKSLVKALSSSGALPDLKGAIVDFYGIGQVDGIVQEKLNQQSIDALRRLWSEIIVAAGGQVGKMVGSIPFGDPDPNSIQVDSIASLDNACLFVLTEAQGFSFLPDTATFVNGEMAEVGAQNIARDIEQAGCDGGLKVTGFAASGRSKTEYPKFEQATIALSKKRATAFKALLISAGVKSDIKAIGGGKGPAIDWNADGSFNEELGKKNRIVEISQN